MKCSRNGKELENVEEYRRSQKGNEAMTSKRRRTNKVNIKQERKTKKNKKKHDSHLSDQKHKKGFSRTREARLGNPGAVG